VALVGCLLMAADGSEVRPWKPAGISSGKFESHAAFDPRTGDLYFVRSSPQFTGWRIFVSQCTDGGWSTPQPPAFAGDGVEADPYFTQDGGSLYFISTRSVDGAKQQDLDIWRVDRDAAGTWGAPVRLPEPVNSSGAEWFPRPGADGWLYFGSDRPGGLGRTDIWRARQDAAGRWKLENLGTAVNTAGDEYEPLPEPDGPRMILMADGSLYQTAKTLTGWVPRTKLGPEVNQNGTEIGALFSPSGRSLMFSRDTKGADSGEFFVWYEHGPEAWPPDCPKSAQTLSVPPDSPRWDLQGKAERAEYQGRNCLLLDGGAAVLNDLEMRDGVVDVDVATPASRGFFGIQFRIANEGANAEWVYLRQHKSGLPDALQYTPVLNTGLNWQIYNGPGFTGAVDIPRDVWFHLRLEVSGAQAKLYVKDLDNPVLVMNDLKSGVQKGQVALAVLTGATYFSNFEIRSTPDAPWERRLPPMPPGTLTKWSLSPSFDALERDLERPLSPAESAAMSWQEVEAEAPGFVAINRYRESPHPKVSFARDFSKRLEPQPGMKVVYARTSIHSHRDQVKKLYLGYSDDVSLFLNGKILFRGRSAQNFRDPAFLGIVSPENDAVYLPLKKGSNELVLAVSELGGGWGFICRLAEPES
jgi:hypothetical protein